MLTSRLSPLYPLTAITVILLVYFYYSLDLEFTPGGFKPQQFTRPPVADGKFDWAKRVEKNPVTSFIQLPMRGAVKIPRIQFRFQEDSVSAARETIEKRNEVKQAFKHAWSGYRNRAWLKDEVAPVSGIARSHFGNWAASLVDALDTLWIMDLRTEFEEAVEGVKKIDFTTTADIEINTFETNIRYLGGLLSAYDLSNGKYPVLLEKALELGDLLYAAFDTPNRMPITRWRWQRARDGENQTAGYGVVLSEIGSFSLEFTRLSQLTGDPKFYDAIQRVTDMFAEQQQVTKLPGMLPLVGNAKEADFGADRTFSFGAMADSFYEYLPKQYLLLGGLSGQYRRMYEHAIDTAKDNLMFRPMSKENVDMLMTGNVYMKSPSDIELDPLGQHLTCFVGGMVGLGAKIFDRPDDIATARKLVNGCLWAHQSMPTGIMPETYRVVPCDNTTICAWDEKKWHTEVARWNNDFEPTASAMKKNKWLEENRVYPGFSAITDRRYILRPEAIESMFILYRITGDKKLQDDAWNMFRLIDTYTRAEFGHSALRDMTVVPPPKSDSMESFWMAETLKYFYLIFSEPDLVSLDDWVFNTEAHPFKRPHFK
ncbi:hypothetical protein BP6252_09145 [Coleophoma cylindrospora]|uniref:alpha-1,2-Mannosidase n=1 Tax=Coleophoma cylindrospora TaxID=1849047 RepID=A0A3D8R141_9HELO|nr:hypothetical protein BP6252_09145 [Coleophoma cylindrospora]